MIFGPRNPDERRPWIQPPPTLGQQADDAGCLPLRIPRSACLAVLILLAAPRLAGAEEPFAKIDEVRVGLDGIYKVGHWTPIHVQIEVGPERFQGRLVIQAPDPNGTTAEFTSRDFELPAEANESRTTYVKLGQASGSLTVILQSNAGERVTRRITAAELPAAFSTDQQLMIRLGGGTAAAGTAVPSNYPGVDRLVDRSVDRLSDLPRHWLGYSGIDAVFLTTSADALLTQVDDLQWAALRQWVELGGTVIACGASRAETWFGPDKPLAWLLPGEFAGVVNQRQTSGIEQFAGATKRLDPGGTDRLGFSVPMALVLNPRGQVEASEGFGAQQSATVVRATAALGRVVFVAFDLDRAPFATWPDQPRLMARLLSFALDATVDDDATHARLGPVAHVGFTDLVGQLRHALDQFAGVTLVPFSWIAGLMALYIVTVGPLDFWLLRRWGRPEWTWLTFAVSVVAFTALAVGLAYHWKGTSFRCKQVTVVDVDLSSGTVRGTTWAHLFGPKTSRVTLETKPCVSLDWDAPPQQITSWQGLPGDGFGGLDRAETAAPFKDPYQFRLDLDPPDQADARMEEYPIAVWSSQSLLGEWWGRATWRETAMALSANSDATVSGTIVNPLSLDLQDVYLLYDRWAIRLGNLPQGGRMQVNNAAGVDLQTLLTQRSVVQGRNVVTPWDQANTDVDRVMQLIMFYGAAKGRAYTRLEHRYQRTLDWSDHVTAKQAVLWGRSRVPGAEILLDEKAVSQTEDWTYCRVLIPVAPPGEA